MRRMTTRSASCSNAPEPRPRRTIVRLSSNNSRLGEVRAPLEREGCECYDLP
jgi:hypothetical protein